MKEKAEVHINAECVGVIFSGILIFLGHLSGFLFSVGPNFLTL